MLFSLDFANNTIYYGFFFFKNVALFFLICTAIAQLSNPITKLIISIGIPTNETKAETQMCLVTVETKI